MGLTRQGKRVKIRSCPETDNSVQFVSAREEIASRKMLNS
jgi:hypothetical protein